MEWTPAAVVAVYAAVVSTVNAAWSIRTGLRDRAHVRLSVMLAAKLGDRSGKRRLMLTMTNTGRRLVTIGKWGGTYTRAAKDEGRDFFTVSAGLPKELKESEQHHEFTDQLAELAEHGLEALWVYDTAGRRWSVPKGQVKRVDREIRTFVSKSK
jgi:hypothetical protein